MMRLVLAEMNRLRSRRFAVIGAIVVLALLAAFQVAVYFSVREPSAQDMADGQRNYEVALADYEANKEQNAQFEKECVDAGNPPEECSMKPKLEQFQPGRSSFDEMAGTAVMLTTFLLGLAMLFVGASFIGGEYTSGSLSNWLSFIPERGKVYFSKVIGLAIPAAILSAVASAASLACAAIIVKSQGLPVTGVGDLAEMSARGIALVVMFAIIGFAIALVTRHTAAAAGLVLGYLFFAFILQPIAFAVPALQRLQPWQPESNVMAFLQHGSVYYINKEVAEPDGTMILQQFEKTISFTHSAVYLGVILVIAILGTFVIFRRRDVN